MAALGTVAERLDAKGLTDESQILRQVLAELQRAPREVPASTAAEILEVTPQTIRNWVRGGILPGRRDRTGHVYVPLDALESSLRLRQVLPDRPAGTVTDEEIDAEIEAVRAERRTWAAGER
jgi:hypothetical protein